MMNDSNDLISLTSTWFIKLGYEQEALVALDELAKNVQQHKPNTLLYLIHKPYSGTQLQSLPPVDKNSILFVEMYSNIQAFFDHLNGKIFTDFMKSLGLI